MTVVGKMTSGAFGDPAGYEETLYAAADGNCFLYTNGGEQSPYKSEKLVSVSKAKPRRGRSRTSKTLQDSRVN